MPLITLSQCFHSGISLMLFHWSCQNNPGSGSQQDESFSLSNLGCFSEDDAKKVRSLETSLGPIVQDPTLFLVSLLLSTTNCGAGAEAKNPFCLTHLQLSFYLERHLAAETANSQSHVLDVFERIEDVTLFEPYLTVLEEFSTEGTKAAYKSPF